MMEMNRTCIFLSIKGLQILSHLPLVLASHVFWKQPTSLSLPLRVLVFTYKHNQTLAWLSVDVCALDPHSCLLASPAWIAVVGGNSSVDVASAASIASGGGH